MKLNDINLSDYDYHLDINKIAGYPINLREGSRLLYVEKNSNSIKEYLFSDVINLIPNDSLIIRNSTKVIPARILMKKNTGGIIEVLLLKPLLPYQDYQLSLNSKTAVVWECIVGGRIRNINELSIEYNNICLSAEILNKVDNIAQISFRWNDDKLTFSDVINSFGKMPLPPYIKRESTDDDRLRYQTVYAKFDGSVAAPTAGLHFTNNLFDKLKDNGIAINDVVLHVGMGTFLPISSDNAKEHKMHSEEILIKKDTIEQIVIHLIGKKNIIAIGTTSVRTIESLFWWAVKFINNPTRSFYLDLSQEEPYVLSERYDALFVLQKLLELMTDNDIYEIHGQTSLMIAPGYNFKVINGMFTNFHLPKSTLLLLVSSFLGYDLWKRTYDYALSNNFRFLSYGDSSLLLNHK